MPESLSENLKYHRYPAPGKLSVESRKPCLTQQDLAKAYTPGVAEPCLEIRRSPELVYEYTGKGNTVAVVSDGTAVLGLGNIGPEAGLPVMEGKAVLLKRFADIDSVPICLGRVSGSDGRTDAGRLIRAVECLEPSFGAINLEDIAAPACFEVEAELRKRLAIPVFHDDQHGTAIITLAALLNAAELLGKRLPEMRIVVNGAGAAGQACALLLLAAGVREENVVMCDRLGALTPERATDGRTRRLATRRPVRTAREALQGADVLLGCSVGNCIAPDMIRGMGRDPIVFALANPVPEIDPALALEAGAAVVGTGRSDHPNQINNVLGFPGIFRGALDVRARDITLGMNLAAAQALTEVTRAEVPPGALEILARAYPEDAAAGVFAGSRPLKSNYILPKPFDPRVVPRVARRVAEKAVEEGVARRPIGDFDAYERSVAGRLEAG